MFKLTTDPRVHWPVRVRVPVDGGGHRVDTFTVEFRILGRERLNELQAQDSNGQALLREVVLGWSELLDERGDALPFFAGTRDLLFDVPFVAAALLEAYAEALSGGARKN